MGQFKPMVKMYTTEPSVELKLKKGGSVKKPVKMMDGGTMGALAGSLPARGGMGPAGASPMRPSLAERMRRRKMMGGREMPQATPQAMPEAAPQAMPQAMPQGQMMKKGGMTLKKHASMPASKAHKGLKTGGVIMGQGGFKKGGKV